MSYQEPIVMADLDAFTRGYIECAVWTEHEITCDDDTTLSESCLRQMVKDCADFQESHSDLLDQCENDGQAGHDFWLTRNRHGAGFWDGDYPEPIGAKLTEASHAFGSAELYEAEDGYVYHL